MTIVITNSFRGGTGKSTVMSNLALYLASMGNRVIIIDGDIISPGIHAMFGFDSESFEHTLTDYVKGKCDIRDIIYDISESLLLREGALHIVPSSIVKSNIVELLQEEKKRIAKIVKAFRKVEKEYKPHYVLVDTHPGLNADFIAMLEDADILFNIIRPDNQDYQGLEVTSDLAKKFKLKNYIVLNRVHKKLNMSQLKKKISKVFKVDVPVTLPFSEDLMLAQSEHIWIDKYPEDSFSTGIQELAKDVFGVERKHTLEIMREILINLHDKKGIAFEDLPWVNAPHKKFMECFNELLKNKFMKKDKKKFLTITKRGKDFLKKYKTVTKFVKDFRL